MRGGYVEGNIRATEVVINGTVRGRCEGGGASVLWNTGSLREIAALWNW